MNIKNSKLLFILFAGLLIWCAVIYGSQPQPIRFNHNLHIAEVGMDCPDCHQYVATNRKATLPGKDVCMDCHSEVQGESGEEQKLVSLLQSTRELDWQRVYVLPDHVYFSHFRHVTLGQVGCQMCHGDMKEMTLPPVKQAVNIIDMDFCMDCHEERQVYNDCLACHN